MDMTLGDTQLILRTCRRLRLTENQTAYVLATAYWETAHTMKPVREAYWLSEQWRRGNLRYYPWYGRGYVQLTWRTNYEHAGEVLDVDLTSDPDVAMQPKIAAEVLVRGMMEGWFTGKRLPMYVNDETTGFVEARRVVNGTDRAREIARLAIAYRKELDALPTGVGGATAGAIAAIIGAIAAAFAGVMSWLN